MMFIIYVLRCQTEIIYINVNVLIEPGISLSKNQHYHFTKSGDKYEPF